MSVEFDHTKVVNALRGDAEFALTSRDWTARIRIQHGNSCQDLVIQDGVVISFEASNDSEADVTLAGSDEAWAAFIAGNPESRAAFLQDGIGGFRMSGDFMAHLAPYSPAILRLSRVLRGTTGTALELVHADRDPFEDTDVAVGRYIRFDVDEIRYRVYFEEAGNGPVPLLLQHTAGADSRQWRHFLADPELQQKYRIIAYDLPYHGRSLPPLKGTPWWKQEYAPSRDLIMKWVVGLSRALKLDRPVVMGVSVGGQLVPDLLAHYGDEFRGGVSVNGFYHNDSMNDVDNSPYHHPRIPAEYWADRMYEVTSALAPEEFRREVAWVYASTGPAVYKGDNEYYAHGHDLRVDGHLIDTSKTPLWAVAGEFDPAAVWPGGAPEIAANIPGAQYQTLAGLSHFAMTDDPVAFNAAVKPLLADIVARTSRATV
ncbi:alpha/beta fold hydrolase [Rhodococcoides fascians]|uniref:alpha/beta fold hydrolase n=1 Tax=Rhodococcoides fascians TaxID=1828 RepID=UPI0006910555|nr:alpha/beta fold hydrolase [Rhodococcus fascians]